MNRIYLVRHAETQWALNGRHTGRTDIPITEKGRAQAQLLGAHLKKIPFQTVYVSPLKRAYETCQIAGFEPQAIVDPDLMEWDYGKYEGLTKSEIHQTDPGWTIFAKGAPGGESVEDIGRRADRFKSKITHDLKNGNVLVFSSGHLLRVLTARWLNLTPDYGKYLLLFPGAISIVGHEGTNPVIISWNDTHHLK